MMAGQNVRMNSGSGLGSPDLDVPKSYLSPVIRQQILFFDVTLSHPDKNSGENYSTKQCCNCIRGSHAVLVFFAIKEIKRQQCYTTTCCLCMCMDTINEKQLHSCSQMVSNKTILGLPGT